MGIVLEVVVCTHCNQFLSSPSHSNPCQPGICPYHTHKTAWVKSLQWPSYSNPRGQLSSFHLFGHRVVSDATDHSHFLKILLYLASSHPPLLVLCLSYIQTAPSQSPALVPSLTSDLTSIECLQLWGPWFALHLVASSCLMALKTSLCWWCPRSSLWSSGFLISSSHAVFIVYTPALECKPHQKNIFIYFIYYT